MENKVLVLKSNAVVDIGGLDNILNETLSNLMNYDFTIDIMNEDDNKALKKIIANSRKEFKAINDEKILFKKAILEPFDEVDTMIKDFKVEFDEKLNKAIEKSNQFDNDQLQIRIGMFKEYFKKNNKHTFITFEQVGLNIIKSTSDSKYIEQIDAFLSKIETDLMVIENQDNKERVLSAYYDTLDLGQSISIVNTQIEREQALNKEIERNKGISTPKEVIKQEEIKETVKNKYSMRLEMTKNEATELKQFLLEKGIKFDIREQLS